MPPTSLLTLTPPPTAPDDLSGVVRALADGRTVGLDDALDRVRLTDPLVAAIAAADAGSRLALVGLAELHELLRRAAAEAPDRPVLRWWVVAVLGERAFLDTDFGAIPLALAALAEMPDDAFGPELLLFVRGRLRRIASSAYLVVPSPESVADHRRLRDAALEDFRRCDFTAQVAITRGVSAALHALATWDDMLEDLEHVRDARALLDHVDGSVWAPLLDHLFLFAALACGDADAIAAGLQAVDRHRAVHRVLAAVADFGHAMDALSRTGGGDDAVGQVRRALDRLRDTHPHLLPLTRLRAANVLADCGRIDAARSVGLAALDWPAINPVMTVVTDLLRIRLDLLDGVDHRVDAVLGPLGRLEELGHVRQAGGIALRISGDYARRGETDACGSLHAWGAARLPATHRWTPWERQWAAPQPPTSVSPPAAARIVVRVLTPLLEVEVAGRPIVLRTMPAKLLLALVVAQPAPLHVEQAVDTLWPDVDLEVGRRRLNTVVHRLRTSLGLADGELRRTGDVLVLSTSDLRCDLFAAREALRDDALDAGPWLACTGNLCNVQFPYDDLFVDERRRFATEAARTIEVIVRTADGATGRQLRQARESLAGDAAAVAW